MRISATKGSCKDCGNEFYLSETARKLDIARGLSEPERCPTCRKLRRREISSGGAIFLEPPKEYDDSKRCWRKFGLRQIVRNSLKRIPVFDNSVPVEFPSLWSRFAESLKSPEDRTLAMKSCGIQNERDLEIAKTFYRIAPAADALVKNLEDANGTRFSVLIGPTGTGKSTWVPYRILKSKIGELGRICVTQPRLVTLKRIDSDEPYSLDKDMTIPGFIARELLRTTGVGPGHEVGFQYGGEYEQQDRYTKLLYVSDGTLINWLRDGRIGEFDVVMIDEAHEQSENMEQIFALLKYRISLYPRMRVVIASATANVQKFREYFGDGNPDSVFLAEPQGKSTTNHRIFRRPLENWINCFGGLSITEEVKTLGKISSPTDLLRKLPEVVSNVVDAIRNVEGFTELKIPSGDILVFVPTVRSLEKVQEALERLAQAQNTSFEVVVCHREPKEGEFERFRDSEMRATAASETGQATQPQRVIIATNYAETSVTFANIRYVIDSGLILQPEWDTRICSFRHDCKWHSKAGCTQRQGRVGRTKPGEYFALYSKEIYEAFLDQTPPELTRKPLDSFLLSAQAAGIESLESFKWMSRDEIPSGIEVNRSLEALKRRNAFDSDGDATHRGLELGQLGLARIELAECLALADRFACAYEVATFFSFIAQPGSPFDNTENGLLSYARWKSTCRDDLDFYLRVFHHWWNTTKDTRRQWEIDNSIKEHFLSKVLTYRDNTLSSLPRKDEKRGDRSLDVRRLDRVRIVFAFCLSEWTYEVDDSSAQQFKPLSSLCPCPIPVVIDQDSACVAQRNIKAFICFDRVEKRQGSLFAKHIVRIETKWLKEVKDSGNLGLSLLLSKLSNYTQGMRVKSSVTAAPEPVSSLSCSIGEILFGLLVIRTIPKRINSDAIALTEHLTSGVPVFLLNEINSRLQSGDIVRAVVERIDQKTGSVFVSQKSIHDQYGESRSSVCYGVVKYAAADKLNHNVYSLWVELEPGVFGELKPSRMSEAEWEFFSTERIGKKVSVRVTGKTDEGRLLLESVQR